VGASGARDGNGSDGVGLALAAGAGAGGEPRIRPAGPGDLGWVLERHAVLYLTEFGFGTSFEASVAHIVAGIAAAARDEGQRGWIAETAAGRLGSVFCTRQDADVARLRLLLVEPAARGLRLGQRLVETCLDFATAAGYRSIMPSTQDVCVVARRIYAAAGFDLVESTAGAGYDSTGRSEVWRRELPAAW
jgi:GNAT superfamily N-acetyltransferase